MGVLLDRFICCAAESDANAGAVLATMCQIAQLERQSPLAIARGRVHCGSHLGAKYDACVYNWGPGIKRLDSL